MISGEPPRFLASLALAMGLTALASGLAQAQDTSLRMWTFLNPEGTSGREKALARIIQDFEAANPGVRIQVEQQVWDQLTPKFLAAHDAGSAPDVVWVNSDLLGTVIQSGALADIRSQFTDADLADLDNELLRAATVDGALYGTGQSYMIYGLIARGRYLAEAGVTEDSIRSWDDLLEVARKLTVREGDTVTRWGLCQNLGMTKVDPGVLLAHLLTGAGDTPAFDAAGQAHWANERGVEGIRRVVELIDEGVSPPEAVNWNNDEMYDQFAAGRCAMITGASVRVGNMQGATGDDAISFIRYPSGTPGTPSNHAISNWTTGVWSGSPRKEEAARLIAALSSPEADQEWVTMGGTIPFRASTATTLADHMGEEKYRFLGTAMDYIRASGWVPPFGADISGYRDDMNRAIQQVLLRGADPLAALSEAEQAYNGRHGY
ncbi:MAG: hypothetical protein DI556_08190 [Rhodovulum sulfidophilum]|uniref:Sugar ABC transporter substrate-binding protein n=1 Tax=Rhodovulum sulfidophilum TaxID=35806 RepID=A0A2W5NAI1_RHOSU|nr:MAG: hypothetical protein DI556_08190 [Rhodovulum sulfidophilum]